jgi:pyruvate dehydrogenase E1 component
VGQLYQPEDSGQLMFYREDREGQILQEGITEAGAFSSWLAAATSYANNGITMVPFFIFYSMFGFQRIGDLAWAAGDSRARGFLIGGTSGRTTLEGEGLQHQDGHSHLLASTIPNCRAYDPAYAYEFAVILQDGLRRMVAEQEDVFYYVTTLNENYAQPSMPEGAEEGVLRGMHPIREAAGGELRVQLMGAGAILREVLAAAEILADEHGVDADVWSVTSFTELRRDGIEAERWSRLHPADAPALPYVGRMLADRPGPVVAASDYMRTVADQIRPFVPGDYHVLGTDGFGRSDTRAQLRRFFEVDRHNVVVTALWALAEQGAITPDAVNDAISRYDIDAEALPPWRR